MAITQDEIQSIVNMVISAIRTNSLTIEQLTPVTSLTLTDTFELSGGKKISYGILSDLIKALSSTEIDALKLLIAKKDLKSVEFNVTKDSATLTVSSKNSSISCSVPLATTHQVGFMTPDDKKTLLKASETANDASQTAAKNKAYIEQLDSFVSKQAEQLEEAVGLLKDTANSFDERLVQLEQLNIVPLVYMSAYTKALSTSADLLNRVKLDRPGLQLVMDLTTARVKNDFLVLVREDGSAVINPLPFAKKAGFGTSDFNTSYYYRYAHLFLTAKESARIRPVFLPASDTEAAIEELSARMDRLEELSGGENSGELEGSILSSITEALTVAKTARSRALEAIDAAGEAQQAVASVSLMAERVAPYLRYHAMPVTAVRHDGCFDSDGPGIYLVPANDKYEWTNFEFGNINDQPGTPWDTWESPEKAQAWEEHWEAVKTALSLPYDLNLMDFGTVSDADDAMDANDGLYFCIEEQRYYRVTANGSILEPMLFPSDLEEFTDEDIEAAAQKALNSVNNK